MVTQSRIDAARAAYAAAQATTQTARAAVDTAAAAEATALKLFESLSAQWAQEQTNAAYAPGAPNPNQTNVTGNY